MSRKDHDVATVNEEPASSTTTNRQINQASPEETRNTGKRHFAPEQKQSKSDQGCGCGQHGR
jgi:hypothetical protein